MATRRRLLQVLPTVRRASRVQGGRSQQHRSPNLGTWRCVRLWSTREWRGARLRRCLSLLHDRSFTLGLAGIRASAFYPNRVWRKSETLASHCLHPGDPSLPHAVPLSALTGQRNRMSGEVPLIQFRGSFVLPARTKEPQVAQASASRRERGLAAPLAGPGRRDPSPAPGVQPAERASEPAARSRCCCSILFRSPKK